MNCGDHEADMCSVCPTKDGSSEGCSGDCHWVEEHKECIKKGTIFPHVRPTGIKV